MGLKMAAERRKQSLSSLITSLSSSATTTSSTSPSLPSSPPRPLQPQQPKKTPNTVRSKSLLGPGSGGGGSLLLQQVRYCVWVFSRLIFDRKFLRKGSLMNKSRADHFIYFPISNFLVPSVAQLVVVACDATFP